VKVIFRGRGKEVTDWIGFKQEMLIS